MAEPIVVVVSIDTEEDNWAPARDRLTVENIRELPRLDRLLERLGAKATYFATYEVATTAWSGEIIRALATSGRAEIGAHVHPWNTPPISMELTPASTMLANLPRETQAAKVRVLTDVIASAVGERPYSFRAGRWGLDAGTAAVVTECGYRVDSSVTPFRSWSRDHGPSHIGAPINVYRIDPATDHRKPSSTGQLIEVPVSWGYTQSNWNFAQRLNLILDTPRLQWLQLNRLAAKLHIINHAVLSPELEPVADMAALVNDLLARGARHLHITFHSPTLRAGLSPFAPTQAGVERLYASLEAIIEHIGTTTPVRFATVGEAAQLLAPKLPDSH